MSTRRRRLSDQKLTVAFMQLDVSGVLSGGLAGSPDLVGLARLIPELGLVASELEDEAMGALVAARNGACVGTLTGS